MLDFRKDWLLKHLLLFSRHHKSKLWIKGHYKNLSLFIMHYPHYKKEKGYYADDAKYHLTRKTRYYTLIHGK